MITCPHGYTIENSDIHPIKVRPLHKVPITEEYEKIKKIINYENSKGNNSVVIPITRFENIEKLLNHGFKVSQMNKKFDNEFGIIIRVYW